MFLNGSELFPAEAKELALAADYCIAANGGSRLAMELGVVPDYIVGDFDSVSDEISEWIEKHHIPVEQFPRPKDRTDFELALEMAISRGPRELIILGAFGGRVDHFLLNCLVPVRLVPPEVKVFMFGSGAYVSRVGAGETVRFPQKQGVLLSLISLAKRTHVSSLTGTRWALESEALEQGEGRGLSNEIIDPEAVLSVSDGVLLAIQQQEGS